MIGIIVADEHELNKFLFPLKEQKKIAQFTFNIYTTQHEEIVVVHSGIGLTNAATATQTLILFFNIKKIYNYGAVGGDQDMHIFDVVTPKKIFYHDVITPWYHRGQIPGEEAYYCNAASGYLISNLASGNSFLHSAETISEIQKSIDVKIFDMETAAIAQTAFKNKIPLFVIKCVSDTIGYDSVNNKQDINVRIAKAGKIAFEAMINEIENKK